MLLRQPLNKAWGDRATLVAIVIVMIVLTFFVVYMDLHKQAYKGLPDQILALVAIGFGILAVFYEWRLHRAFAIQEKDIKDIVLSVHTRYLSEWPGYMRNITNLICPED